MTKLEDLLYSLTSIIVQYHDSQKGITKLVEESDKQLLRKKSRALAISIIEDRVAIKGFSKGKVNANLEKLIKDCTNGYPDRKPLLYFILHEIYFIKSIRDHKAPIDSEILEKYKAQITQMLINFKNLLTTPKGTMVEVKQSRLEGESDGVISLSGLRNDAYLYGGEYCNSGNLVKEDVFDRLNITVAYTDQEMFEEASNMCTEYQNTLLVPHLVEENTRLKEENKKALQKTAQLTEGLKDSESTKLSQSAKIQELLVGNATLRKESQLVQQKYSQASDSIREISETNHTQSDRIQELEKTIKGLEQRISELGQPKTSPPTYNPGLFPFYASMYGPLNKYRSSTTTLSTDEVNPTVAKFD